MIRIVYCMSLIMLVSIPLDAVSAQEGPARAARERAAEREAAMRRAESQAKSRAAVEGAKRENDKAFNKPPVNSMSATQLKQATQAASSASRAGLGQMKDVSPRDNVAPRPVPKPTGGGGNTNARGRVPY